MKSLALIAFVFLTGNMFAQGALGEVIGEVVDKTTNQAIYYATVTIEDNGTKYQAKTGQDGRFRISGIPSGKYLLKIIFYEDTMKNIAVNVPMDGFDNLGVIKFDAGAMIEIPDIVVHGNELKLEYGALPVTQMSQDEIKVSPNKFDQKSLITSMSSDVKQTDDGELVFRGARKGDMVYMMDGVKSNEINNVPSCAIGRMMVYTGGIPAKYGDTLGGVVVMETLSYFDLYRAWEAQQILSGKM